MAVVYGREYDGEVLSFEPSGALWEASLVMRDRETDSWWSIITGDAVGGQLVGRKLDELPVSEKVRWGEWKARYPETLVLSVEGEEHDPRNPYAGYFRSERTFQHIEAKDPRLPAKEPVFAFEMDGARYAVPHAAIEGGAVAVIGDEAVFLFRRRGADVFESSHAWTAPGAGDRFENRADGWTDTKTGAVYEEGAGFKGKSGDHERVGGFDTFWYNLANIVSGSVLLETGGENQLKIRKE
jgi:hypothetical protein